MPCKLKIARLLLIGISVLLTAAATASAGTISITPRVKQVTVDEKKGLEISVDNSGDEAAKNVQIQIDLTDETLAGPRWDTLNPGEKKSYTFFLEKLPTEPGVYPVYVTVDFADLNLYPFTALEITLVNVGADSRPARLHGKADPVYIKKKGKLNFSLKNKDGDAKHVSVRVFGPKELNFDDGALMLDLPASGIVDQSMKVTNFSALAGAGYPVFLVFEYNLDNLHYTYVLKSPVRVQAGGMSITSRKNAIFIGIGVLILAALAEIIRRVAKKK